MILNKPTIKKRNKFNPYEKNNFSVALFGATLSFNITNAQMAKQKGIEYSVLSKHINSLIKENTDSSKSVLTKELTHLVKSKDEKVLTLAARVYENAFDNKLEADALKDKIQKQFPQGKLARTTAFNKIFYDPNKDTNPEVFENRYNDWIAQFPKKLFSDQDLKDYDEALETLATKFGAKGNVNKAISTLAQLKNSSNYIRSVYMLINYVPRKDLAQYRPLMGEAYQITLDTLNSKHPDAGNSIAAMFSRYIKSEYASTLLADKNYDLAIQLATEKLEKYNYEAFATSKDIITAVKSYVEKENYPEALNILEKYMDKNGPTESVKPLAETVYSKLNKTLTFEEYIAVYDQKYKQQILDKYKKEIIKKEAPKFSLLNMKGATVSLSDLKGKVVVLDFWATWCGPCIASFPGMQTAVKKYANDPEVEFLFIDVFENNKNYKENVIKFISDKKYDFNVVYDEMNNRSKSVATAYGVDAIPTKVIIDKEGFIRFQSAGGSGSINALITELDTKISLAKTN